MAIAAGGFAPGRCCRCGRADFSDGRGGGWGGAGADRPHSHLLPNLLGPIIIYATLTIIPQAILQESFLSFLGIGVTAASWGSLASDGISRMNPIVSYWWLIFFPCLALVVTLLSLNLIGDGLRDALTRSCGGKVMRHPILNS